MKRLEDLPQIATSQLGGLNATGQLKGKIKLAAAEQKTPKRRVAWRPLAAGVAAAALCLCVGLWSLPSLQKSTDAAPDAPVPSVGLLGSRAAGEGSAADRREHNARALLDVPSGSVSVSGASNNAPAYHSIFEAETNGNFPLVRVGDATYRMLTTPASVSDALQGDSLGEVTEYTLEPALSTDGVASNIVSAGETVYAVSGMKGAMAVANVNGSRRVFQRVSFAGTAIIGSESLVDTLANASHVTALELSDVGKIDDAAQAQSLVQTLLDNATYQSASVSGKQSLLIYLDNGLTLQLFCGDDAVSACGTWSCPEFFEAFTVAVDA